MDGLGVAKNNPGNAVTLAQPQNLIRYWETSAHTYLKASGPSVGLPDGVYGNSEVGHMNIGSGKVIFQNLPKINKAIQSGTFFSNQKLREAYNHATQYRSAIHIMGCLSDGAVHAHIDHFIATLEYYARLKFNGKVYFHAFTDGRDTAPDSAPKYLARLQEAIDFHKLGHIATIIGRAHAMDRNQRWERTQKAYNLLVNGQGQSFASFNEALQASYQNKTMDEYIEPVTIPDQGQIVTIKDNDCVLFLNFRSDRAIQLSEAFLKPEFTHFPVKPYQNLMFCGMVSYEKEFPKHVIFPKEYLKLSLGRILSENGLRQLRIAESEKFPHVTYFFNGGLPIKYSGEDRIEIQSPRVATYDLKPEMSALEVTEALEKRIDLGLYDFIALNLANPDMVGHTGNLEACIKAVKVTDYCVDRLVKRFVANGGTVILTADHGNVEEVIKDDGQIDTEHSYNPVPFMIVNPTKSIRSLQSGALQSIAPTILDLFGLQKPAEMSGRSLIS